MLPFHPQMSVLLSMRYLQTAVDGAAALDSPEAESEGYLLEKGVKETYQDVRATLLNLAKFGQVDPAEGPSGAEEGEKTTDTNTEKAATSPPAS